MTSRESGRKDPQPSQADEEWRREINAERQLFADLTVAVEELFDGHPTFPDAFGQEELTFVEDPNSNAYITTYFDERLGEVRDIPGVKPTVYGGRNLRVTMNRTRNQGGPEVRVTSWIIPTAWIQDEIPNKATSAGQNRIVAKTNDYYDRFFVNSVERGEEGHLQSGGQAQEDAVRELIEVIGQAQRGELTTI